MSIPYQIADVVDFDVVVGEGLTIARPIVNSNEPLENTLDVLIRADPLNASDPADPSTWCFIGGTNRQDFPMRANEALNVHVTRRNMIYFRGPVGHRLHIVSARLNDVNARR